eukprot:11190821-Lingulodinium_polyedra.AAC.1
MLDRLMSREFFRRARDHRRRFRRQPRPRGWGATAVTIGGSSAHSAPAATATPAMGGSPMHPAAPAA